MRLSLRQLAVIRELMSSDTATEVATKLNVSQPGVSKVLRQAEDELGFQLFERIKGRLYPTPEAISLIPELEKVFGAVEAFDRVAADMRDATSGKISIAALPTLANVFLPDIVRDFRNELPNVKISVQVLPSLRIADQVAEGHVDIGLLGDSTDVPTNKSEDLFYCESVCIMPLGHPLAEKSRVSLAELATYPMVSYFLDSPFGTRIRKIFTDAGLDYIPAIEAGASTTICSMVESGAGIAIVEPYLLYSERPPQVISRPLSPVIPIRPRLIYPRYRPLTKAARLFVDMFKESLAEKSRIYGDGNGTHDPG